MHARRHGLSLMVMIGVCAGALGSAAAQQTQPVRTTQPTQPTQPTQTVQLAQAAPSLPPVPPDRRPDVIFVPTPQEVVDAMLEVAKVGKDDVLYDLGSGDGRIPITAARRYGTRAVGFDIDAQRIAEAKANAKSAGVTDRVTFVHGDIFKLDAAELGKASVIALYLLPELNLQLRPTLLRLKPGTRIVSHAFDMGDWAPDRAFTVAGRQVYFWTVPAQR
jgi:precorrin-6B methylase 2